MLVLKNKFFNILKVYILFLFPYYIFSPLFADTRINIYTPEGKSLYGWEMTEAGSEDLEDWYDWAQEEIEDEELNATIIGYSTRKYNCHGYAWMESENRNEYWIGYSASENDPEETYFSDQNYSNDNLPSYSSNSSSTATHIYYVDGDHSVRKIQNSYPTSLDGSKNCVSKWNMGPIVQHQEGHDVYWQQGGQTMAYYILKKNHSGTQSYYDKIWVGAGSQTHALTGNTIIESNASLTIKSGSTVNLSNYSLTSTGGTIILESGATVNPHYCIKSGTTIKGFYPSFSSALSNVISGQTLEVNTSTTLASNIVVPAGVTLKRKSGVRITLGSYSVTKASTGSIIIEDGYYNIPDIRLQSSSTITGLYPSISSAFTASSTGQSVHIRGTHTFSNNFTIPSGEILYTESYSELKFPSGKYLYVNGVLNGNNATFTRTSGTWGGIKYQSGSSGSLSNCTINNATYGLYLYNSSPDIESTSINNSAVYLNNSSSEFTDSYINSDDAIYLFYIYNSSPDLYENTIESEDAMLSVYANNGSDPWFGGINGVTNNYGYNIITASAMSDGVMWAQGGSSPMLGYGGAGPYYCGYNSILSSCYYPLAAIDGSSSIDAAWCWWGQSSAPSCYGDVNTADALSSNPGGGSSLDKAGSVPATQTDDKPSPSDDLWYSALDHYLKQDISNTIEVLKEIIQVYPESSNAYKALNLITRIGNSEKSINSLDILEELSSDTKSISIKSGLLAKQVQIHRTAQNYKEAVRISQTILSYYPDSEKSYYALFDLFNLYQKDLKDTVAANNVLELLKKDYPEKDLTIIAQIDNGETVRLSKKNMPEKNIINATSELTPTEFKLLGNYPNPFNPTTNIKFTLAEASNVTINIYNVLGQKVCTLTQSGLNTGMHQITWDGRNELGKEVTSGLYIMRFEARSAEQDFQAFKRMLLIR